MQTSSLKEQWYVFDDLKNAKSQLLISFHLWYLHQQFCDFCMFDIYSQNRNILNISIVLLNTVILFMEQFSRRRWRLISGQSLNKFSYCTSWTAMNCIVLAFRKHNTLLLGQIWAFVFFVGCTIARYLSTTPQTANKAGR